VKPGVHEPSAEPDFFLCDLPGETSFSRADREADGSDETSVVESDANGTDSSGEVDVLGSSSLSRFSPRAFFLLLDLLLSRFSFIPMWVGSFSLACLERPW